MTVIQKHFADMGLNRLLVLRTDFSPGAVFVSRSTKPKGAYRDNIFDYTSEADYTYTHSVKSAIKEFDAVLASLNLDRSMEATVALSFLDVVVPVDIKSTIKIDSKVTIDLINARGFRMPITDLDRYLKSDSSAEFRKSMAEFYDKYHNAKVAIGYEIYRTKDIRIIAEEGKNIGADLNVGEIGPIESAESGFMYKKVSNRELIIEGKQSYVFHSLSMI